MPPSVARLRWQALTTAIKTTILHYTSKKYPRDWSLMFHVQFAVLRRLDASMLNWTVEEVLSSQINLMWSGPKLFNELPFRAQRWMGDSCFNRDFGGRKEFFRTRNTCHS